MNKNGNGVCGGLVYARGERVITRVGRTKVMTSSARALARKWSCAKAPLHKSIFYKVLTYYDKWECVSVHVCTVYSRSEPIK